MEWYRLCSATRALPHPSSKHFLEKAKITQGYYPSDRVTAPKDGDSQYHLTCGYAWYNKAGY